MAGLGNTWPDGSVDSPALPPKVSEVQCLIKEGTGTYTVVWDSAHLGEEYNVTLYDHNDTAVSGPVTTYSTSCEISHAVDPKVQYRIGVRPSRNKEAEVKVPVFSDIAVRLDKVYLTGENTLALIYDFPGQVTDRVRVRIENTEKSIDRETEFKPYERGIDLRSMGLGGLKDFDLYLGAVSIIDQVEVYQRFENIPAVQVNMEKPEIPEIHLTEASSHDSICLALTCEGSGIWAGAKGGISLYWGGELFWQSEAAEQTEGKYHFAIKKEELAAAGDIGLKFFLETGIVRSDESHMQSLISGTPVCRNIEYISQEKALVQMDGRREGFYQYQILAGDRESTASYEKGGGMDLLTVDIVPTLQAAYKCGKLTGYYSDKIPVLQPAWYLFGEEYPCICMSDTPKPARDQDIQIPLPEEITFEAEITGEYFNLIYQEKEGGKTPVLKLDKKVWDFTEGEERKSVRDAYESFLLDMEKQKVAVEGQRKIQNLIGDYLPQSLKEFACYNYHFQDNRMELFPGVVLRAEYSMYQYVGDDAVSHYENGYTGTFCQEAAVIVRDGKLCLDPFAGMLSDGKYVPEMAQPAGGGVLSAAGAAGFLDLQFQGMRREYIRLSYPDEFPELSGKGHPEVCYNVSLMASSSRQSMEVAWKNYMDTGISTADSPVACFRGRTQVTPCMTVKYQGEEKRLPLFTTPRDLAGNFGGRVKLLRKGKRIYCFEAKAQKWMADIPLYMGDEIELV